MVTSFAVRSTQTQAEKHFRQQTAETTSTQMTGIGIYVPDLTDKLLEPRRYVTADEFINIRANQVTQQSAQICCKRQENIFFKCKNALLCENLKKNVLSIERSNATLLSDVLTKLISS